MITDIVRIYHYKTKILHHIYYSKADNEFLIPLNETAKCINLGTEDWKPEYNGDSHYVLSCNTILKDDIYIKESEWLQDKEKVIEENIHLDEFIFNQIFLDSYNAIQVIGFLCI
jgi:hypothetical protein